MIGISETLEPFQAIKHTLTVSSNNQYLSRLSFYTPNKFGSEIQSENTIFFIGEPAPQRVSFLHPLWRETFYEKSHKNRLPFFTSRGLPENRPSQSAIDKLHGMPCFIKKLNIIKYKKQMQARFSSYSCLRNSMTIPMTLRPTVPHSFPGSHLGKSGCSI